MPKLLIDCDPGVDDAIAILLAAGHPDAEIVAITTVAGNQVIEKVTVNARRIASVAGLKDVPIAAGCAAPLIRDQVLAGEIHGESGLGGGEYVDPAVPVTDRHAVDLIIETVLADPGAVTLVPIGPLTNIAVALRREPRIVEAVAGVVLMGGSYTRGNTTPAAEFNIYADPEAAAAVFAAGWPVTMVGLDLTHQARATPELVSRIEQLDSPVGEFVLRLLRNFDERMAELGWKTGPLAIHDACAVAYAIDPTLMPGAPARVEVETRSELTYGMTVTDFRMRRGPANAQVPQRLDAERFATMLVDSLARVSGGG